MYYIIFKGQVVGPMDAMQIMAYNVDENTQVSVDGHNWRPLFTYPELMQAYRAASHPTHSNLTDSKRVLAGIFAIIFGCLGIQYFIIGKTAGGLITILLSIVTCGLWGIVCFIQGIMMLCMTDREFEDKYVLSPSTLPLF